MVEEIEKVIVEPDDLVKRVNLALDFAIRFGGTDGAHHKDWVIDQMVRTLTGENYEQVVAAARAGDDGPETYDWDCGIAP